MRYFLYRHPTDMRKSFDSLSGIILNEMKTDPTNGDVYIFINRTRNRIKLLHFEPGGFVLYYKRLEEGTLELPETDHNKAKITWSDLVLIIQGISLKNIKKRRRYPHKIVE